MASSRAKRHSSFAAAFPALRGRATASEAVQGRPSAGGKGLIRVPAEGKPAGRPPGALRGNTPGISTDSTESELSNFILCQDCATPLSGLDPHCTDLVFHILGL